MEANASGTTAQQSSLRNSSYVEGPDTARADARSAAQNAPLRRRGKAKRHVGSFHDLPAYLKDNEFIQSHYRVELTVWESLKSLFSLHNETGNVWTHLFGFALFVVLTIVTVYKRPSPLGLDTLRELEKKLYSYGSSVSSFSLPSLSDFSLPNSLDLYALEQKLVEYGKANWQELVNMETRIQGSLAEYVRHYVAHGRSNLADLELRVMRTVTGSLGVEWPVHKWPIYVFTAGAMFCLLTSTVCHLLGCCKVHITQRIWKFDYVGISTLIVASFFPPVYYGFLCDPLLRNFYLLTTCLLGSGCICVSLMNIFATYKYRPFRAMMFAGLGLWGIVPVAHSLVLHRGIWEVELALSYDLLMGAVYLAGAAVYALRIPERWKPGAFDLAFHSHQLFHVAVVVAALIHYRAVNLLVQWRNETGGCPPLLAGLH